ncbi:MAG: hypothetical protein WBG36_14255 [Ornithinimicrobium sp.]
MRATRIGLALGAALTMALPATTASAGASSYEDVQVAQIFNNEGYALFTGPRFEEGCLGEEWSVHGRVKYEITVEGDDFESDVRFDVLEVPI